MTYNHKEAVENLTFKELKENLEWAGKGYRQAYRGKKITCRGCLKDFTLISLYRCFFCGCYFCKSCSTTHFGSRKS